MANPGVGAKFVSVNLNKSYGQNSHHRHNPNHSSNTSSYGSNRTRPGGHVSSGGGGGGGMVVLSRPRSSQKAGPKLSVPPPLNLPSLRKEHERFDPLGSGGGPASGVSGSGSRPSSSGLGWTKPGTIALQEKEVFSDHGNGTDGIDQGLLNVDGVSRGSSVYLPPSARSGVGGPPASASARAQSPAVEKAVVLRGEDFPSLKASLPSTLGPVQKQRDGLNQKQKQVVGEESPHEESDGRLSSLVDMRPQMQSSRHAVGTSLIDSGGESRGFSGSRTSEQARKKEEYFPGPLPLVRLNPRSDWADDERDTSFAFTERGRDHGFSKSEAYWERDFDMPRVSVLPHKPVHNHFDRRGQRDNEAGKVSSSEVPKVDPYVRDVRMPSREGREGNTWRNAPFPKDGVGVPQVESERNGISARSSSLHRETIKENKYSPSPFRENYNDIGRRDNGYGQGGRQPWNKTADLYSSRGAERNTRDRYSNEQRNNYRSDAFLNNSAPKSSYSFGGKGLPVNDPLLNFGREKRSFSKNEKPYFEDPFMKDFGATGFDGVDPFSGGLVGVVKRKKDVPKQTDFHDPVRESFEAELERVQKMQEEERQRIIEEQERALELARREEEERVRLAREQEERQRRVEEEAREAAWRAEQERLEAMRRAEELRIAREEEKQRVFMEEERRKQAAKQKLLELEERMAKRQVEASKGGINSPTAADEKMSGMVKEKDASRLADLDDWEDGERMVERITTSASSDSSSLNRPFEMGSRPHFSSDGSSTFMDRGKPVNSWRRDVYENGSSSNFVIQDPENGHHSPRRDASVGRRSFPRKEFYGGAGIMSPRTYHRAGVPEPHVDDFTQLRGQRWNISADGDHYGRNTEIDSEYHENLVEKFGDAGWGQGRLRGNPYPQYSERLYPNTEADGSYSFGRSRYSMRQPRVLPPPSLGPAHKISYRVENERPGPSTFLEDDMQYNRAARSEPNMQTGYGDGHQENLGQPVLMDVQQQNTENQDQKLDDNATPRCDSQSSLSVSSPPNSPTHLSHDDLDESGDSAVVSAAGEGKDVPLSEQESEPVALSTKAEKENMMIASSDGSTGDDEEWAIENDERLQEQEEYDEDEDGYEEEDEVHEGDDENIDLNENFEDMHLEEKGSSHMMDNLVLGFNEGVEVGMPNDEFEKNSRNEESAYMIPQGSTAPVEERGSFDGSCSDGLALQPVDVTPQVSIDDSSRMFQETEKAMQDLVIQPNNAPHTSAAAEILDHVEASSSSGMSAHHPVAPSIKLASHSSSGQTVMSTVPAVPNQAEVPVKLQFGLFSGPSLIPSPVPAIQIGSIQMPLHLHPQVGPSLTHMHPSQPPIFQFGQLRYTSPISQGVLPLAPQSMAFVPPNVPANFSLNQNPGGSLPIRPVQDTSAHNLMKNDATSLSRDNQPGLVSRNLDQSQGSLSKEANSLPARENYGNAGKMQQGQAEKSHFGDNSARSESCYQVEDRGHHNSVAKNYNSLPNRRESERLPQHGAASSQFVSKEKDFSWLKPQGPVSGGRGKRYVFTVKNSGSNAAPDASRTDSSGFQRRPRRNIQRTEFRVRESADKRQSAALVSSNHIGMDDKSNTNGKGTEISSRSVSRKVFVSNKQLKQTLVSECLSSGPSSSREMDSGSRAEKGSGKEALTKSHNILHYGEGNLKRNICSEEDADASLQSGIVRVFEQPGIEAPSDEDDFIEVRSKRQMLNDRREQREKENKAKSRVLKMPRKPRATSQSTIVPAKSSKISASMSGEASKSLRPDFVSSEGRGLVNIEASAGFNNAIVSQPLAPIGTPAVKIDSQVDRRSQAIRPLQTSSIPVVTGGGKSIGPGLIFDNKNKVPDNVQTSSLGSWGNSRINQQVMALTQTQLDEAMKPEQFDSHASVGDHNSSVSEPTMPSSSILTKDKSFSSAASPINSLLAGEKIQFGAVTSPTILPPSSRAVTLGIGPPGSCRSDIQIPHNLPGAENDCGLFFEKEKHTPESCAHLEDSEAEAEAAASAVAVAAISNDEIVGNGLGACSVSVSDTKSFGADIDGITAGGEQQLASQSRAEESLSVALPADLSVETPPISLWPPLPSPQNSSSQMLSHFPGGPPSHFPFYEMNHMLGGPIFAFGPHDEASSTTQSQSQKSNASASGPIGTWQQCHSGVDSFYGPPAGFTGPFISPPGGIPGVQGPPQMFVYNHFAPVGQFGQVGLSFMGATYIPSGKQPDWKHNPTSSGMSVGEGDINNMNMASAQRNPSNMPAPIQHLAPGSPLLPMPSPMAMFDVSPFQFGENHCAQSSHDLSVQARWQRIPATSLQSVPLSMPLQKQAEGVLNSQFSHGPPVNQSFTSNRFPDSRTSTPSDSNRNFPVAADATVTQLPDELGLVDPSSSTSTGAPAQAVVTNSSSVSTMADAGKTDVQTGSSSNISGQNTSSTFKTQSSHNKNTSAHPYSHSSGYNYQRGGVSQKNSSGAEWSHRRMGFQGRNQSVGAEKSFPSSKMKQIYVAKQTTSGTSTVP
uniref:BAT2 N-terminal domain-containing protein n=1 Tax=Fagus sylvatica TaxID=28930 RepID=A0A2N9H8U9_FAGSY